MTRKTEVIDAVATVLVDPKDSGKFRINRLTLVNAFLDHVVPVCSAPVLKVTALVFRRTINRRKKGGKAEIVIWHPIGTRTLITEMKMSNTTQVTSAIERAEADGWIRVRGGKTSKGSIRELSLGEGFVGLFDDDDI